MRDEEILEHRNCYCEDLRKTEKGRKILSDEGVPDGFCGLCEVCRKPGHVCHYPGPVPYTSCWCDMHYLEEFKGQMLVERRRLMGVSRLGGH